MVEGAFTFLLFLFTSPQKAITNKMEGFWIVTEDNTVMARTWNRIYYFEECSKKELKTHKCKGHYGWAEYDGIYTNLYDLTYITYGVKENADPVSGKRKLIYNDMEYDFVLDLNDKTLEIIDLKNGETILAMKRVPKSEIRNLEY